MSCDVTRTLAKVEIQQTYAADSTWTYVFEAMAQIVIALNTLIYFDDHLKEVFRGKPRAVPEGLLMGIGFLTRPD